jgi:DNA polymerase I
MNTDHLLPQFVTTDNIESLYNDTNYLVLDFETDGEDNGLAINYNNDLVLACWQVVSKDDKVIKTKSKWGSIYEQHELLADISKAGFVVAHNAKFEAQWLKRCGAELRDILFYDTMLAEWVLLGNRKDSKSLDATASRYGTEKKKDLVSKLIKLGVSCRDINPEWLEEYCHYDVEAAKQIFHKQRELITANNQWHLVHTRNLTSTVLADIEFEGLDLDKERVNEEYVRVSKVMQDIGDKLATITGGINLGSPKQLATYLYDELRFKEAKGSDGKPIRTGKGERSVAAPALSALVPTTIEQKQFLSLFKEYNKASSLLEKNLSFFKSVCEERGGKFFGQFMQGVVQTHRLASSGIPIKFKGRKTARSVQLQNIPREYKRLFWAGEDDYDVAEFDGGQLEFRVAVDMGKDKVGYREIVDGTDIHSFTAKVLTENNDPEMLSLPEGKRRQAAKKTTFRPLYGGSTGGKAVEAYCEYFKGKYVGISTTQRGWALKCLDHGMYTTPYGMKFYFPDTKMQRSGYITNTTSIYNFPVQGFATGEIIPLTLVYFWHRSREIDIKIFSTIHDSIAVKVRRGCYDDALAIAKQAFTTDVYEHLRRAYKYKFRVPLGIGAKVSTHWGDTDEEYKVDVFPTGEEVER